MKSCKIPYAKCRLTQKPVTASLYEGEKELECYECKNTVFYKSGYARTGKNGVLHDVRAHFFHSVESTCRGESVPHLLAKDIIANLWTFEFYHQCSRCNEAYPVVINQNTHRSVQEYHWFDRVGFTSFIPDVAFLDENDKMYSVVEICHTHPIPDCKIHAFNSNAIVWAEVDATHIIDRFNEHDMRLDVLKSSVIKNKHCDTCFAYKEIERLERANALAKFVEDMKRRDEEESRMRELEVQRQKAAVEDEKRRVREFQEKRIATLRQEEAENEKKRKEHYEKQEEERALKKAKFTPLSAERRAALEYVFTSERQRLDYEDRKKYLLAYQDMIVNARKKKREAMHLNK